MNASRLSSESGSALLESISFAVVAFALVLTLGLRLFEYQSQAMELEILARNSLREYLTQQNDSLSVLVKRNLAESEKLHDLEVSVHIDCAPSCFEKPFQIRLVLNAEAISASAFGVVSE